MKNIESSTTGTVSPMPKRSDVTPVPELAWARRAVVGSPPWCLSRWPVTVFRSSEATTSSCAVPGPLDRGDEVLLSIPFDGS